MYLELNHKGRGYMEKQHEHDKELYKSTVLEGKALKPFT